MSPTKEFKWSQELTERLIAQYKAREHLYNQSMTAYKNRHMRENALREIVADLKTLDSSMCIELVKKKINNMRTQYSRERKKFLSFKEKGMVTDEDFVSSLWCYDQLDFLQHHIHIAEDNSDSEATGNYEHVRKKPKIQKTEPRVQYRIAEVERPATRSHQIQVQGMKPETKVEYRIAKDLEPEEIDHILEMDDPEPRLHEELIEIENAENVLQDKVAEISNMLAKKTPKKYDWLGKQVVFEMNKITSEELQEDAAWAIQSILRSTLRKDRLQHQTTSLNQSQVTSSTRIAVRSYKSLKEESLDADRTIDPLAESIEGIFDEEDY